MRMTLRRGCWDCCCCDCCCCCCCDCCCCGACAPPSSARSHSSASSPPPPPPPPAGLPAAPLREASRRLSSAIRKSPCSVRSCTSSTTTWETPAREGSPARLTGDGGGRGVGIVVRLLLCVVVVAWVGVVWLLCGCLSLLPRRVPSFLHARRVQATPLPSPHSPFAAALPAPPPRPASPPPLTKALTAAAGCRSCRRAAACRASRRRRGARGSRRARLLFELCSNSV